MTLHQTLYVYLKANEGWQASAVLERMVWKDNKGKIAKAANIGRRLRELEDGSHHLSFTGSAIAVGYEGVNAKYRYLPPEHERAHRHSNHYWKQPEMLPI